MTIEPYALANSRPPALPAVRAEPNLAQRLDPLSEPQRAELHFGRVEPILQYKPDLFGALRTTVLSWNSFISTANKGDTALHDLHPALERTWLRIESGAHLSGFLGTTTRLDSPQAAATHDIVERHTAIAPLPTRPPLVDIISPKSATPDTEYFLLIERVKHLLDKQKIRDARRALEIGSIRYPANRQIARLLQTIAPGRVSPTGRASSGRELETAWIKQHGHKYRGKWIALDEDHLIAFAATLKELLANLDIGTERENERERLPFIQHLLSE